MPAEEKSRNWKVGVITYSIATPLILASPTMFLLFRQTMFKGEICKFYELADPNNSQQECLADYDSNPDKYIDASGFRYPAFMLGLCAPVFFFAIEFFLNQLLMSWKHLTY